MLNSYYYYYCKLFIGFIFNFFHQSICLYYKLNFPNVFCCSLNEQEEKNEKKNCNKYIYKIQLPLVK